MIVIKTDMKELPKKCIRCEIHTSIFNGTDIGKNYCLNKRLTEDNMLNTRPEWCPLLEKFTDKQLIEKFVKILKAQPRDFIHSYQKGCIVLSDEQIDKLLKEVENGR